MTETHIALFNQKQIRKIIYENEWYFSVVDVIAVLTDSTDPKDYWYRMKTRVNAEEKLELSTICRQLKLTSSDSKKYATDCANTQGLLRIIQSIPSPKAEPFKQWLAKVGYERIQEIENPELSMDRMKELYEKKGYPKDWIDKRVRGIAVRQDLTKEWKDRGVTNNLEYAILTNEIMRGTFGLNVEQYKEVKSLQRENLRDHMNDIELILTMLGEATTTKLTKDRNSKGVPKLKKDAKDGGAVAGRTRKDIEARSGKKVISSENYLDKYDKDSPASISGS